MYVRYAEIVYGQTWYTPIAFPLELPKKCIKLFAYVGDIVLDPFVGGRTTLATSRLLKRRAVGIDISRSTAKSRRKD